MSSRRSRNHHHGDKSKGGHIGKYHELRKSDQSNRVKHRKKKYSESHDQPIDKIDKIDNSKFHNGFKPKIVHKYPYIVKLRRFLNSKEINAIMELADGNFEPSTTIVDNEQIISSGRTSNTAFITDDGQYEKYPKPIHSILEKVCYLTGCKQNQIEGLMVVRYEVGQEYYNHHDYFKSADKDLIKEGGQRIATFFCYLNSLDEGDGGETEFPEIGVKVKPSKGTAVFWWNEDPRGNPLEKTLHRGNPIKKGVKYGLNIWIRDEGW